MPSLSNPSAARIVVVGAGAAGLASGWQLAKAGHDVTIVDRGELGRGALWASGGMLAAGFEASAELDLDHELAKPFSSLMQESLKLWPHWSAELQSFARTPLGFNQDGAVTPVYGEADHARAQTALAQARVLGVSARWLDQKSLADLEPSLSIADGAILFSEDGQLDNRALGPALAGAIFAAGGRLQMRMGVDRLYRRAGGVAGVVCNQDRVLEADFVVLTTGATTLQETPQSIATRPVKGQMLGFGGAAHLAPQRVVRGFSIYLCAKPGGRLIAGATVEPDVDDLTTSDVAEARLVAAARRVVPGLQTLEPEERWSGLRPAALDLMPVMGEVEPGLIMAGGGYRNGVLLAPAMAQAVCAEISGQARPSWARPFVPHRAGLRARRDH